MAKKYKNINKIQKEFCNKLSVAGKNNPLFNLNSIKHFTTLFPTAAGVNKLPLSRGDPQLCYFLQKALKINV